MIGLALFCLLIGTAFLGGYRLYASSDNRDRACAIMWVCSCYALFGLSQTFFSHANTSLQFGAYLGLLRYGLFRLSRGKSART